MRKTPYNAPDFFAKDQNGRDHKLADYRGNWLVLYFYPKDNTPGCTTQACSLRDKMKELEAVNVKVVGVSADNEESHAKFTQKHDLNFTLLVDTEKDMIQNYEAWGKKMYGREGILRKTYIINPKGTVVKVYGRAKPLGHGDEVLQKVKELQQEAKR